MVNPFRGEAEILINGASRVMRLSLGVLAELEHAMGADSLVELVERFESGKFRARDVLVLLEAGLKGGLHPASVDELASAEFGGGIVGAARAAARLLRVTFDLPEAGA